jgi:hypothetical protein
MVLHAPTRLFASIPCLSRRRHQACQLLGTSRHHLIEQYSYLCTSLLFLVRSWTLSARVIVSLVLIHLNSRGAHLVIQVDRAIVGLCMLWQSNVWTLTVVSLSQAHLRFEDGGPRVPARALWVSDHSQE